MYYILYVIVVEPNIKIFQHYSIKGYLYEILKNNLYLKDGSSELGRHKIDEMGCIIRVFVFVQLAVVIAINKQFDCTSKGMWTS